MTDGPKIAAGRAAAVEAPGSAEAWRKVGFSYGAGDIPESPTAAAGSAAAFRRVCQIEQQAVDLMNYAVFLCRKDWRLGITYYQEKDTINYHKAIA